MSTVGSGLKLDSYFYLNIVSNKPKFKVYDIPTNETIIKIESKIDNMIYLFNYKKGYLLHLIL